MLKFVTQEAIKAGNQIPPSVGDINQDILNIIGIGPQPLPATVVLPPAPVLTGDLVEDNLRRQKHDLVRKRAEFEDRLRRVCIAEAQLETRKLVTTMD